MSLGFEHEREIQAQEHERIVSQFLAQLDKGIAPEDYLPPNNDEDSGDGGLREPASPKPRPTPPTIEYLDPRSGGDSPFTQRCGDFTLQLAGVS